MDLIEERQPAHAAAKDSFTYSELMDLCTLGERLRFWRQAFPAKPDGILGAHVLRECWQFISAADIQADPQFATLIQAVIDKGKEITEA